MWRSDAPEFIRRSGPELSAPWMIWLALVLTLTGVIAVVLALRGKTYSAASEKVAAHILGFGAASLIPLKAWPFENRDPVAFLLAVDSIALGFAILCAKRELSQQPSIEHERLAVPKAIAVDWFGKSPLVQCALEVIERPAVPANRP